MNKELLELSYALKKKRQKRIMNAVLFVIAIFAAVVLSTKFLIFAVSEGSVSMQNDIPPGSHVFFTPIVGSPRRGDVLMIKRLGNKKQNTVRADGQNGRSEQTVSSVIDELSRFVTAQQISTLDISGLMGEHAMLRRVVALPGDTIYMRGNVLFVKPAGEEYFLTEFERTNKPYNAAITALPSFWDTKMGVRADMEEVTLEKDEYFVLGDNRISAVDCRMWGPITLKDVRAKGLFVFFPFNRLRRL